MDRVCCFYRLRVWAGAAGALVAMLCVYGCGSSRGVPKRSASVDNLNTIGRAYAIATDDLGYPPKSKAEFLPFLKAIVDAENAAKEQADGDEPVAAADAPKRTVEGVMRSESD